MEESSIAQKSHIIGAIFLIAGTCIGAGMLALPVETGISGFFPSFLIITLCYLFMISTGLLLVEANLWMEEGAHIVTMASRLLGRYGKYLTIVLYIFMGYGSLVAYSSGASVLLQQVFQEAFHISIARWQACFWFSLIFGMIIGLGTHFLGKVNTALMFGMIASYILLIIFGIGNINPSMLLFNNWSPIIKAFPLLLATFSYQMIVPSLTPYLKRDPQALKLAVILGTTIPYVVYVLWQVIALGIIPPFGENSLHQALINGYAATIPLKHHVSFKYLSSIAEFFAFFALVTSFLGIALGLFDFLADMTGTEKKGVKKLTLLMSVVAPTIVFSVLFPEAFLIALDLTGGFGDAIFSGMIPIAMVYIGRKRKIEGPYTFFGSNYSLVALSVFALFVFAVQIYKLSI